MMNNQNRCECKYPNQFTDPHYSYTEHHVTNEKSTSRKIPSRPSSAKTVNTTSNDNKNKSIKSVRTTLSDSKVIRMTTTVKKKKKPKNDDESPNSSSKFSQLKNDLNTIKDQLLFLTRNKNETLNSNDMQNRYVYLMKKNQEHEKEIASLKAKNADLEKKLEEGFGINEAVKAKQNLDIYEQKLNTLYNELMNSSNAMSSVCRHCPRNDQQNSKLAQNSNSIVSNVRQAPMASDSQQKIQHPQCVCREQNVELLKSVEELQNQLNETLLELENTRKAAAEFSQQQHAEMEKRCECYIHQLIQKSQEIQDLTYIIENLKLTKNCRCAPSSEIQQSNGIMYNEQSNNDKRYNHLQESENEKNLMQQLAQTQKLVAELNNINSELGAKIAELTVDNQTKDGVIQRQNAELASKAKKIELITKNEENLKQKTVKMQEELVALKISASNKAKATLQSKDCCSQMADDLQELITSFYYEINKTKAKDELIQKQNRDICYLQCALSCQERQLQSVQNELKILQTELTATLKDKEELVNHLNKLDNMNEEFLLLEGHYFSECNCENDM